MTKKKTLFKNISLFLCLVPMLVLSLFCLVPKKEDLKVSAFADEVINDFTFVGANLFIPITYKNFSNGNFDRNQISNIKISFNLENGVYSCYLSGNTNNPGLTSYVSISGFADSIVNAESAVEGSTYLKRVYMNDNINGFEYRVFHSGQLSSNIYKIVLSSYENVMTSVSKPANYYNTVTYIDNNNEYITFEFPLYTNLGNFPTGYLFEERTYYITTSFEDNTYYQEGYDNGYDVGVSEGKDLGYQEGYSSGVTVGYGNGYNEGVANSQDYSFLSLIGAVIDAPVSAFTSLLNFNLLGFNMLAFVTGLITLGVILLIVKLFIGGK